MSNLVVLAYDDVATANQVRDRLFAMQKEQLITLDDAVVVERTADGGVKLHQVSHTVGGGALSGTFWGGLIGLLFFAPIVGMAIGAASGAAAGAITDVGIDDTLMRDLATNLPPGSAALFLLVERATADKVVPEIAAYGGRLVRSSLSDEQETTLREAVTHARSAAATAAAG